MKRYLLVRWLPVPSAILFVVCIAFLLPKVVLTAFWFNSLWVPYIGQLVEWTGKTFIAPYLPVGVWDAVTKLIAGAHLAYEGFVATLHAVTAGLPEKYGARTEVFVRGYLVEGWILVAEVATIIRYFVIKKFLA